MNGQRVSVLGVKYTSVYKVFFHAIVIGSVSVNHNRGRHDSADTITSLVTPIKQRDTRVFIEQKTHCEVQHIRGYIRLIETRSNLKQSAESGSYELSCISNNVRL